MHCPGKYYNGPQKKFVRCDICGGVNHEANEGDNCKVEDFSGEVRPTTGSCTCDKFCDDPCPQHGWGTFICHWCKAPIDAPLSVSSYMKVVCKFCGSVYVGQEDDAHGYWKMIYPSQEKTNGTPSI